MKPIRVDFPNGIGKLPKSTGVYIAGCGKKVEYVGISDNVQQRVKQQIRDGMDACYIKVIPTKTRKQALALEKELISQKCPPRNKMKPRHCKNIFDLVFG